LKNKLTGLWCLKNVRSHKSHLRLIGTWCCVTADPYELLAPPHPMKTPTTSGVMYDDGEGDEDSEIDM